MITIQEVEKLAQLARIKLAEGEKEAMTREIDSILSYVDEIKKAEVNMDAAARLGAVHNVFREDSVVNSTPETRDALLAEAPERVDDFVAVKKIIG